MKRFLLLVTTVISSAIIMTSCGPKCKKCHMEVMGVKSPEQKYCGEQLEAVEKTPSMVCE